VAAGVARVVTTLEDPDPRVAGRGHAMLRTAGIELATGVLEADARRAQAGFLSRVTRGRPMLTLKLAASLDGRIATGSGESRWITGPEARRCVHAMRARHDAVLIGAGTARADDPELTVRGLGIARQPVRVVASRGLNVSPESRLARTAREVPVWLLHGPEAGHAARVAWEEAGARLLEVPAAEGQGLDPAAMLAALGREGLTRVFCEGGGALAAALLGARLVDRLALFTGGLALGAEGRPALGTLGLSALSEAPRFLLRESRSLGTDTLQLWDAE
jgi:diaminohydroxyphosphoribosylaminopyrimidine deaminase/5-amino-6-(5-phosphoribosylamino)uracil reductase